ncbi:MAG: gamma-glutamylcyclotransferase [Labedaea sp.]
MRSPFISAEFPADPYPGARAGVSFVELDGLGWVLRPGAPQGWVVEDEPAAELDAWLARRGAAAVDERLPLLSYGSNACPGKLAWLRDVRALRGPAVMLEADVTDVAAVWSAGLRARDGQRPAVLAGAPGAVERHAVWLVTPDQLAVLDLVEGRGTRYRLGWVHAPTTLANGQRFDWVLAYVARTEAIGLDVRTELNRSPLLVDGRPVRISDVDQATALTLTGLPAESDELEIIDVLDEPSWRDLDGLTNHSGRG